MAVEEIAETVSAIAIALLAQLLRTTREQGARWSISLDMDNATNHPFAGPASPAPPQNAYRTGPVKVPSFTQAGKH
jgi:hypothetical protein